MKNLLKKLFPCFFPKPKPEKIQFINHFYEYGISDMYFTQLLNDHRKSNGLQPLKLTTEKKVIDMACAHIIYMTMQEKPSHDYSDKRFEFMRQEFGQKTYAGECVAYNFSSQKAYLNAYLTSDRHKKILESERFNEVCVVQENMYQIVFLFNRNQN